MKIRNIRECSFVLELVELENIYFWSFFVHRKGVICASHDGISANVKAFYLASEINFA
jgi:hypothetical protein